MFRTLCIFFSLIAYSLTAYAGNTEWYHGKGDGWFFYNEKEEPKEVKEKPKKEPKPIAAAPKKEDPKHKPKEKVYDGPPPMSAAWLKVNLPKYLNLALDDPSPKNVSAYLYLQKLSMDKASQFGKMSKMVTTTNPELDETTRRSQMTASTKYLASYVREDTKKVLSKLAKTTGMYYFYSNSQTCIYCKLSNELMEAYKRNFGFEILAISMDGSAPSSPALGENWTLDSGQSDKLNVLQLPAIFLVHPDDKGITSIVQGSVAYRDLGERMLMAANLHGWLSDKDYNRTRPMNDVPYLSDKGGSSLKTDSKGFVDPNSILTNLSKSQLPINDKRGTP